MLNHATYHLIDQLFLAIENSCIHQLILNLTEIPQSKIFPYNSYRDDVDITNDDDSDDDDNDKMMMMMMMMLR